MKNSLKILIFIIVAIAVMGSFSIVHAQIDVTNIEVFNILNQRATIKWSTYDTATKGIVYYGLDYQSFSNYVGYSAFSYSHESVLTGLQPDKVYYYKILVISNTDETFETYVGSFSTEGMADSQYPSILETKVLQSTNDEAAIYWRADEEVKATIIYGVDGNNLDKSKRISRWETEYEIELTRLLPYRDYYFKIVIEDRGGNTKTYGNYNFNTRSSLTKSTELQITNVQPLGYHEHLVFADQVLVKWQTNMIANSRVYYGTEPTRLNKSIKTVVLPRTTEHRVVINGLEPETVYYYKIKVNDSFYNKSAESPVYSFITASLNYIVSSPTDLPVDTDGDGLYDDYEVEIGTDPLVADTDKDGYGDGTEVTYGYNPLGSGKSNADIFAYNRTRLGHQIEAERAQYLRKALQDRLGNLNISVQHWYKLLNAYIYGDYPVEAIAQAIKYGGKTVHPTIGWSSWKNSDDYREYINK